MDKQQRTEHIFKLEAELRKSEFEYKMRKAKQANREQMINFVVAFTAERARLEMLALFGLIKLDR